MNDATSPLTFNLAGYDHRSACGLLTRRLMPAHLRNLGWIAFAAVVATLITVGIAVRLGYRSSGIGIYLVFFVAYAVLELGLKKRRTLLWRAVSKAPCRAGTIRISVADDGLSMLSDAGQSIYFWKSLVDAIPGKDGIMVLLGDMEFVPIPASAFVDASHQAAVLEQLRAHIRAAKGVTK